MCIGVHYFHPNGGSRFSPGFVLTYYWKCNVSLGFLRKHYRAGMMHALDIEKLQFAAKLCLNFVENT